MKIRKEKIILYLRVRLEDLWIIIPKAADGNATKSNIYKHDSNLLF